MIQLLFILSSISSFSLALPPIAKNAESVQPLNVGEDVPNAELRTAEGKNIQLFQVLKDKKTALIFYRGGWCPYCNVHLKELQGIEKDLQKLGFQIVAISPDRPEELQKSLKKNQVHYRLLSDSQVIAARLFGLAFQVEEELVKKYKNSYQIDLEGSSGQKHHALPVPAVFLIDSSGKIRFRYYNSNYKVRLNGKDLIQKAKSLN